MCRLCVSSRTAFGRGETLRERVAKDDPGSAMGVATLRVGSKVGLGVSFQTPARVGVGQQRGCSLHGM